jgi:hypothetical protein
VRGRKKRCKQALPFTIPSPNVNKIGIMLTRLSVILTRKWGYVMTTLDKTVASSEGNSTNIFVPINQETRVLLFNAYRTASLLTELPPYNELIPALDAMRHMIRALCGDGQHTPPLGFSDKVDLYDRLHSVVGTLATAGKSFRHFYKKNKALLLGLAESEASPQMCLKAMDDIIQTCDSLGVKFNSKATIINVNQPTKILLHNALRNKSARMAHPTAMQYAFIGVTRLCGECCGNSDKGYTFDPPVGFPGVLDAKKEISHILGCLRKGLKDTDMDENGIPYNRKYYKDTNTALADGLGGVNAAPDQRINAIKDIEQAFRAAGINLGTGHDGLPGRK